MKLKRIFLFMGFCLMMLISLPLLAAPQTPTDPPGLLEILVNAFTSLSVMAVAVVALTQLLLTVLKTKNDQVWSWVVSLLLATLGWFLQLGVFTGLPWFWIPIYGAAAGLAANGLFDVPVINWLLSFLVKKKNAA